MSTESNTITTASTVPDEPRTRAAWETPRLRTLSVEETEAKTASTMEDLTLAPS